MSNNSNFGREAFYSGIKYYDEGEYVKARACFEISIKNPRYQEVSIYRLIKIDLKEGKYAKARETLNSDINLNDIDRYRLFGLLEKIENNFKTSQYYFQKCLIEPRTQYIAFLEIAKICSQMGDYSIAQRMLDTLQLNDKYATTATLELISLKICEGNYEEAYNLLKQVDFNIRSAYSKQIKLLNILLLSKLDPTPNNYNPFDHSIDYSICRLLDENDDNLIEHLQKHLNQEDRQSNGCFFENINLNELISSVKEKINIMNPSYCGFNDIYRFRFDYPIGYKGDALTSDITVATIIDTKKIITMYPVQLSPEYNREGFLYDQTISLKRKQGMK